MILLPGTRSLIGVRVIVIYPQTYGLVVANNVHFIYKLVDSPILYLILYSINLIKFNV